jgi:hypothetical protein
LSETVNHPAHYGGKDDPYEVIKVLEAWDLRLALGFCWGNLVKYSARADKKGSALEDRQKAAWYAQRAAEIEARLSEQAGQEAFVSISATGVEPKSTRFTLAGHVVKIDWIAHSYHVTRDGGGAGGGGGAGIWYGHNIDPGGTGNAR